MSNQVDWIKSTICAISSNPPPQMNCSDYSNIQVPSQSSVPVTVIIQFDDFPEEIGWSITSKINANVLAQVDPGVYQVPKSKVQEVVFVPAESSYIFEIEDNVGDGLCSSSVGIGQCNSLPGNFLVVLGTNSDGQILASGGGNFGFRSIKDFDVPKDFTEDDLSGANLDGQIPLSIEIQLDDRPQEIGWRVDEVGIELIEIMRVPIGIYVQPMQKIFRTVMLKEGQLYYFRL